MEKEITLNKAAQLLKKSKDIYRSYSFPATAISVNAIEANNVNTVMTKIEELKNKTKENFEIANDARVFYFTLKSEIVNSNVESGLNAIINMIEFFKSSKNLIEQMIMRYDNVTNVERLMGTSNSMIKIDECLTTQELEDLLKAVETEITRQDSKYSNISLFIDMKDFSINNLKLQKDIINAKINEYEDKKFEINNSKKIKITIPDSLIKEFGF